MPDETIPTTYAAMNSDIVGLLRMADPAVGTGQIQHYAAARIEELELQLRQANERLERVDLYEDHEDE